MKTILVAAVGCSLASDDAIGLHLLKDLSNPESFDAGQPWDEPNDTPIQNGIWEIRSWEDADSLTVAQELMEIDRPVFLIDCADMGKEGGSTRSFGRDAIHFSSSSVSTHGFGLADAIELACSLGFESEIRIFGVQPFDCTPGTSLTPEMTACYSTILGDCRQSLENFTAESN